MSVHYIVHAASAAVVLLVLTVALSVANSDSSISAGAHAAGKQVPPSASECTIVQRPKHTIRKCPCSSSTFSTIASVDRAEMLRLLTRASGCQASALTRK
jgi:hypothetical protein